MRSAARSAPVTAKDSELDDEIAAGLRAQPKRLPCKLFYDDVGSRLFERICELDEYYLTRTELGILRAHVGDVARRTGPGSRVVEYGSGAALKTRLLLDALDVPSAYVPIEIAPGPLEASARALKERYPELEVQPICADYTRELELPPASTGIRTLCFFPGSTFGNFEPREGREFLERVRGHCGQDGLLLLGVDLKKDRAVLEAAYDDRSGVTAEFNRNILRVLNREYGASFAPDAFEHRAVYDERSGRVEMHLVSRRHQRVAVAGTVVTFAAGEPIVTEHCYKFELDELVRLARAAGFEALDAWTDERRWFAVVLFRVR